MKDPLYFVTTNTVDRRRVLTLPGVPQELALAWCAMDRISGWAVGRYVILPDHVHFFVRATGTRKRLEEAVRDWKKWTARRIAKLANIDPPVWQPEFFDYVLRSPSSYAQKWDYVRQNPVRAGLVTAPEEWPHAGEIASFRVRHL